MAKRKRPRLHGQEVPVGKRAEPDGKSLWVECPVCGGTGPTIQRDCTCRQGYVETGFTQERFDALIKENDRLLVAVSNIELAVIDRDDYAVRAVVYEVIGGRALDVEAARSRSKE